MRAKRAAFVLLWILPFPLRAQAPAIVSIDEEPHHKLALRNDYIEVHQILLPTGDAFKLHRHDLDEIAVVVSGGTSVAENLGKPPAIQTSETGKVSYARAPRVHLIRNTGQTTIHNVAISLLRPQTNLRNLCSAPNAEQPLDCPSAVPAGPPPAYTDWPQFETDQTRVSLSRVHPKESEPVGEPGRDELVIAIDNVVMGSTAGKWPDKILHAGDFEWVSRQDSGRTIRNESEEDARFVAVSFKPI